MALPESTPILPLGDDIQRDVLGLTAAILENHARLDSETRNTRPKVEPICESLPGNDGTDLSEQQRAHEALRQSEERLQMVIHATHDAVWDLNLIDGSMTWNDWYTRSFGRPPRSVSSWTWWLDHVHPDDLERVASSLQAAIRGSEHSWSGEYRFLRTEGVWADVCDRAYIARDNSGRACRVVGAMLDLTERKRVEEALRKKEEELRQAQKLESLGLLAGGIAHEFNNLLQVIGGCTRFALRELAREEPRYADLQEVLKATDRATALTRQILAFGRRCNLVPRSIDPNAVLADLVKMLGPILGEHIQLDRVSGGDVGTVHADPGELQQVLLNLCLNARDAMPSGGKLLLKAEKVVLDERRWDYGFQTKPGPHVVFHVADSGCGMEPDTLNRIFEPFFTTKGVGKGTGLGLSRAYGMVQQHQGAIEVHSMPGQGTTLKIHLPSGHDLRDATETATAPSSQVGSETILLAEDELLVQRLAVRILDEAGYTVLVASDGDEASRMFEENRTAIALVILDAIMPKRSGHDVYRHMKAIDPDVKVIFCTGYDPETAQSAYIHQEQLPLIQKPFDPNMLLSTVREVLDGHPQGRIDGHPTQ